MSVSRWVRGWCVLLGLAVVPVLEGTLLQFDVFRETNSRVFVDGMLEDFQESSSAGGAGSLATFGSLLTNGGRTAARSTGDEIAANAQFVDTTFAGGSTYGAFSNAVATLGFRNVFGTPRDVGFDFFLPPTELELTTNSELAPFHELSASAEAHIEILYTSGAGLVGLANFDFEVELLSNHDNLPTVTPSVGASYSVSVFGEPDPPNDMACLR